MKSQDEIKNRVGVSNNHTWRRLICYSYFTTTYFFFHLLNDSLCFTLRSYVFLLVFFFDGGRLFTRREIFRGAVIIRGNGCMSYASSHAVTVLLTKTQSGAVVNDLFSSTSFSHKTIFFDESSAKFESNSRSVKGLCPIDPWNRKVVFCKTVGNIDPTWWL